MEIWLSEVYPPFGAANLSWRDWYLRAMLVGIVSVRSGVTALQDDVINLAFTPDAVDATASAYRDLGLKGWITASMWDESFVNGLPFIADLLPDDLKARLNALAVPGHRDQIDLFHHLRKTWHGKDGIRIILGPCGPQRCSIVAPAWERSSAAGTWRAKSRPPIPMKVSRKRSGTSSTQDSIAKVPSPASCVSPTCRVSSPASWRSDSHAMASNESA